MGVEKGLGPLGEFQHRQKPAGAGGRQNAHEDQQPHLAHRVQLVQLLAREAVGPFGDAPTERVVADERFEEREALHKAGPLQNDVRVVLGEAVKVFGSDGVNQDKASRLQAAKDIKEQAHISGDGFRRQTAAGRNFLDALSGKKARFKDTPCDLVGAQM
jgi:hypothetical protein